MTSRPFMFVLVLGSWGSGALADSSDGWFTHAPRKELRPVFTMRPDGSAEGLDGQRTFKISGVDLEAVDGAWVKVFPVKGGRHYRFSALRKTANVESPRRSALAKITWQDADGNLVPCDDDLARPEYPLDRDRTVAGQTVVAGTYLVPQRATQAKLELRLRWTQGSVEWSQVRLAEADPPQPRPVRLATIHHRPAHGKTNAEKCEQFAPLIAEAARQRADLVCLPESLTFYHSGRSLAACAEPIPGPSTKYFGALAKKHDLYIVAGLTEREGSVCYNTAVLLGPDGDLVGTYRKVCLPREEIEAGLTPGEQYPVFATRFGTVGLMICWDVQFPEVARNLSARGAEVIAMPIWGGNPTLAKARAIENQIYLVSSTYSDGTGESMVSGVWDQEGRLRVQNGSEWGTVLVTDVDLEQRVRWNWLGDLKARIDRERPAGGFLD